MTRRLAGPRTSSAAAPVSSQRTSASVTVVISGEDAPASSGRLLMGMRAIRLSAASVSTDRC